MRRLIASALILVLSAGLCATAAIAAPVDFHIVQQDISVNRAAHTAKFSITFNQPPDFTDRVNGQLDAFQYEIDANSTDLKHPFTATDVDAIIRGSEISTTQGIPVRVRTGDGGPNSGGWGPIRAFLPFHMAGDTVQFTAPLLDLSNTTGEFRYRAFSTHDGAITGQAVGAVIPLPAALWPGAALLGGLIAASRLRIIRRLV